MPIGIPDMVQDMDGRVSEDTGICGVMAMAGDPQGQLSAPPGRFGIIGGLENCCMPWLPVIMEGCCIPWVPAAIEECCMPWLPVIMEGCCIPWVPVVMEGLQVPGTWLISWRQEQFVFIQGGAGLCILVQPQVPEPLLLL